jgi:hypothetical protein
MLSVDMLNVVMLSVVRLNVVRLSVVAPPLCESATSLAFKYATFSNRKSETH